MLNLSLAHKESNNRFQEFIKPGLLGKRQSNLIIELYLITKIF